jgi:hypothetical protein
MNKISFIFTNFIYRIFNKSSPELKQYTHEPDLKSRIQDLVHPIMKEIGYPKMNSTRFFFSSPIDPTMAFATNSSVHVCPLFVINLSEIPENLRPQGWKDPRLCDLHFLQKLSDWIAEKCNIAKQTVSFIHCAAAKTMLRLKEDPQGMKALRAGIVHELGHVALNHDSHSTLSVRTMEKEADAYAATRLHDGLEGIQIGFTAWQDSLRDVRNNPCFDIKTRLLMRLLITPNGNLLPLYFSHGFFETRIKQAADAVRDCR